MTKTKTPTPRIKDEDILHVVPLHDTYEHLVSKKCWCQPTQDDENPEIMVHHSADEREKYETGQRQVH